MANPNMVIAGVADLDGDGAVDLVWRNQLTGDVQLWKMNAEQASILGLSPSVTDLNWKLVGK